jgi:hypothetical protein
VLEHPQVGPLELSYEKPAVTGADGQVLVLFHAAPASDASQSLALLAQIAAEGAFPPVGAAPRGTS